MSGNGNSPAKFPAGRALVSFGAGCCVTGACMAGLAALMAQQGLSQDAAWPWRPVRSVRAACSAAG